MSKDVSLDRQKELYKLVISEGKCAVHVKNRKEEDFVYELMNSKRMTEELQEFTRTNAVDSPAHYTSGDIECIDAIEAALGKEGCAAFCQGNVIKYNWRYKAKGGIEDLKKAQWYQQKMIEVLT